MMKSVSNIILTIFFLSLFCSSFAFAQSKEEVKSVIYKKNFYLFSLLEEIPEFKDRIALKKFENDYQNLTSTMPKDSLQMNFIMDRIIFNEEEINDYKKLLTHIIFENPQYKTILYKHLIESGKYIRYSNFDEKDFFVEVIEVELRGINRILNIEGKCQRGRFTEIDRSKLDCSNSENIRKRFEIIAADFKKSNTRLPYKLSLDIALDLMVMNSATSVANFEPIDKGENASAINQLKNIDWNNYKYSAILVPGNGPSGSDQISKRTVDRIKSAVQQLKNNEAPVLIFSGGNVHPFQTAFNEAFEMKKYAISELGIPEENIIMEAFARHTTTNIRNTNRLIYWYNIPFDKKILIVTDDEQAEKITNPKFGIRSFAEIKHIPYLNMVKLKSSIVEYLPTRESLQIDSDDYLDP